MKYIQKTGAPHEYMAWCRRVRGTPSEDFRSLQNPEKASLHEALLQEQGWLCAYTMRRVGNDSSHIEHIKPESLCRLARAGSDLDYENLVACFPRDGIGGEYRYGAQKKGDWWADDGHDFVSPLQQNCETRFRFDIDGNIEAVGNYPAAVKTIRVLALDHPSLTEDRKRVIFEYVFGESGRDPLSKAQVLRVINEVLQRDGRYRFREFCLAIRHALVEYLEQLAKRANRRRFGG